MNALNLSGAINAFRILINPALSLPHATVPHFSHLPTSLGSAFPQQADGRPIDIRAVVLDKDNCFAVPNTNEIHKSCSAKFAELRKAYPGNKLLIVSNSAGATQTSDSENGALALEAATKTTVLRHAVKKPGCGDEIMRFFKADSDVDVTHPSQVAVIGDRVFTDVLLANMMGARAIWVRDGVVPDNGLVRLIHPLSLIFR